MSTMAFQSSLYQLLSISNTTAPCFSALEMPCKSMPIANATNEVNAQTGTVEEEPKEENLESELREMKAETSPPTASAPSTTPLDKDLKKAQFSLH
ncbi:hypothetical protein V6N13_004664 [Hibiscus sabdariffa]